MKRLRLPLMLVLLVGVALLLAACGGKGGSY
jgi:predicted small secreted protein